MSDALEWRGRPCLVDEVVHVLRHRIYGGAYQPGELLRQQQLAEDLNVSRTPLREALRVLQSEGLVQAEGARGVSVARIDRERLLNAYTVREMLDGLAARQATERAACRARARLMPFIEQQRLTLDPWMPADYVRHNVGFHAAIFELAGNEFLNAHLPVVRLTSTVFAPSLFFDGQRARPAIEEHERVVEAIAGGRADEAEQLARAHIRETLQLLQADAAPAPRAA